MRKVAIYCRVSTEEQDADKQEYICQDYCKRYEIEVYKVYKDVISGTTTSRPEFNEMLSDMRLYRYNTIMVTKLDRIGRSLSHLLSLFDEFKNFDFSNAVFNQDLSGVIEVSVSEEVDLDFIKKSGLVE